MKESYEYTDRELLEPRSGRSDIALLSKWAGGIGLSYSRVRGSGALIIRSHVYYCRSRRSQRG